MRAIFSIIFVSLLGTLAIAGPGQNARRFDFLPITSARKFGVYILGSNDTSLRGREAPCGDLYQEYLRLREGLTNATTNDTVPDLIYKTSNCILEALSPLETQQISSAAVLLGLTPVLFSTLGPTIGEIGLISFRRPLLGFFLSVGTVITSPSRVLSDYDDRLADVLRRPPGLGRMVNENVFGRNLSRTPMLIVLGLLQYLLAATAAGNIFYTSWDLSVRSILSLESTTVWWLPAWSGTPIIGFILMTIAIYVTHLLRRHPDISSDEYELQEPLTTPNLRRGSSPTMVRRCRSGLILSLLPSFAHPQMPFTILDFCWITELAHNVATVLAFLQILFGTILFSSLLFVAAADAAIILIRYAVSVLVCRIIIAIELGGMRVQEISTKKS